MLGVCYYPEHWPRSLLGRGRAAHARTRNRLCAHRRIRLVAHRAAARRISMGLARSRLRRLRRAGLKIVLGTPTATPPKWLMDEHPDIAPIDEEGGRAASARAATTRSPRKLTSARARASSRRSRSATASMPRSRAGRPTTNTAAMAPFCPGDRTTPRRSATGCAAATNRPTTSTPPGARCSGRWRSRASRRSRCRTSTVTEANPAARLDFRRFASEQVLRLRPHASRDHPPPFARAAGSPTISWASSPDSIISRSAENLDFAAWDSYPIGFVERFPFSDAERRRWQETVASGYRRRSITISIAGSGAAASG